MNSWLICYDIADPTRLRRVACACEDYGTRKQLSVFLMRLAPVQLEKLRGRLLEIIHHSEDQVLIVPLCGKCVGGIQTLGRPMDAVDGGDVVLIV
jgi:CRISPR-associated protein Cas2